MINARATHQNVSFVEKTHTPESVNQMSGNLFKASHVANHTVGPWEFFDAIRNDEDLKRMPHQEYWSWPQWDRFFALAEQHGMTAQEDGKEARFHFMPLGDGLMRQWRRIKAAKERGLSSYEFYLEETARQDAEKRHIENMQRYQSETRAKERDAAVKSESRSGVVQDVRF